MIRPGVRQLIPVDRFLAAVLRWGSMLLLVFLLVLLAAGVLVRFLPLFSMGWADEVVELAFAWMVFLGTAALWRDSGHITVAFLPEMLGNSRPRWILDALVALLALAFLSVFTWQGWLLTTQAVGNRTPILELPKPWWYAAIPVSGAMMIGYTLGRCVRALRRGRARPEKSGVS